jgi:chromosome segregation ATPase
MKKLNFLAVGILSLLIAGCETTAGSRVSQTDIDSLNAKISSLQSQLSEKDAEISRIQNQMREEESARTQAENEKRMLSEKLDSALSKLESAPKKSKSYDSDLK